MKALTNGCVLTDRGLRERHTVLVHDGCTHAVMKDEDVPEKVTETLDLDGKPLMPGFIDVQVNGGGTLFNDAPGVDAIRTIGRARRASGVVGAALEDSGGWCSPIVDGRHVHPAILRVTLAGSNLDMASAVRNAVTLLKRDEAEAVRMASRYPAEFLGLGRSLGRIKQGCRANPVLADDDFKVSDTWIDGHRCRS